MVAKYGSVKSLRLVFHCIHSLMDTCAFVCVHVYTILQHFEIFSFLSFSNSFVFYHFHFRLQFKESVATKFKADIEQMRLIFAGKILKDNETLKDHKVKDGSTVHLVIKKKPRAVLDLNTFVDLQAQMQNELVSNPEMIRAIFDTPVVQQMMFNPDTIRSLLTSNPRMQDLMQRDPEISHTLDNPELLRQAMESVCTPARLQEIMG